MSRTRKVFVKSFGCQMNVYDSHRMADTLAPAGFSETPHIADATWSSQHHTSRRRSTALFRDGRVREFKDAASRAARCCRGGRLRGAGRGQEITRRASAVDLVVGSQYHRLPDLLMRVQAPTNRRHGIPGRRQIRRWPHHALKRSPDAAFPLSSRCRKGLRQILHLLRGALYARRRSVAPGGKMSRRSSVLQPVREVTLMDRTSMPIMDKTPRAARLHPPVCQGWRAPGICGCATHQPPARHGR